MKELKMFDKAPGSTSGKKMLDVAVGPHFRRGNGIASVNQIWVVALIPAMLASVFAFGTESLRVMGLCVLFAVGFDVLAEKLAPSRDLTSNWNTVLLAVMLAFMMPINAPWWLLLTGCFFMVIFGKKIFGGIGSYPAQPAVLSLAILQLSWPQRMDHTAALRTLDWDITMVEPLRLVKSMGAFAESQFSYFDLLIGHQVAGVGAGMVLFIIIGGAFLIYARELEWHIPAGFFGGLLVTGTIFWLYDPTTFASPLFYLFSGGTVFMGFFLLTDHTTSPVNKNAMIIFGALAGALLILIRGYSNHVDGIAFAVLLVNLCSPLLDMMIKPKVKGAENE